MWYNKFACKCMEAFMKVRDVNQMAEQRGTHAQHVEAGRQSHKHS